MGESALALPHLSRSVLIALYGVSGPIRGLCAVAKPCDGATGRRAGRAHSGRHRRRAPPADFLHLDHRGPGGCARVARIARHLA